MKKQFVISHPSYPNPATRYNDTISADFYVLATQRVEDGKRFITLVNKNDSSNSLNLEIVNSIDPQILNLQFSSYEVKFIEENLDGSWTEGSGVPETCGDGICDPGETCEADSCCEGVTYNISTQKCCAGNVYTGNCCSDFDCTSPATCNQVTHLCESPSSDSSCFISTLTVMLIPWIGE